MKKSVRNRKYVDVPKRDNSYSISLMIKMYGCTNDIQRHVTKRTVTVMTAGGCNVLRTVEKMNR
jgi:hypothetical protein